MNNLKDIVGTGQPYLLLSINSILERLWPLCQPNIMHFSVRLCFFFGLRCRPRARDNVVSHQ